MRNNDRMRIHALLEHSRANGPGVRAVVWTQGCTLGCPGCFNPETHPNAGGEWASVFELSERIRAIPGIEGVTISGGEPLQQLAPLTELLRQVRQSAGLSSVVFTGFEPDEISRLPGHEALLAQIDVLIAGRYHPEQRLATGLRGSANKQLLFYSTRYSPQDFEQLPEAEIIISTDGQVTLSGINPLNYRSIKIEE
jgi:anaerobic ribonucleoside-triphosphate reductase activating protein